MLRRYSEARNPEELGIHVMSLYKCRKVSRVHGEVVPSSEKETEGWGATDKFTVLHLTAGPNATEHSACCRKRGLYPEHVDLWRPASLDANEMPVFTLNEQKELEKLCPQNQREFKRLRQELCRKGRALAEAAALLNASLRTQAFWGKNGDD